jgi:hypothetical protein
MDAGCAWFGVRDDDADQAPVLMVKDIDSKGHQARRDQAVASGRPGVRPRLGSAEAPGVPGTCCYLPHLAALVRRMPRSKIRKACSTRAGVFSMQTSGAARRAGEPPGRNASCAPSRESRRTLLGGHAAGERARRLSHSYDPHSARFPLGERKNSALCELFTRDLRCDVCNVRAGAVKNVVTALELRRLDRGDVCE